MTGETKAAQSIELRIGINVGDVMVEDGDVFVAWRERRGAVRGIVRPGGGVLLSLSAYDQVREQGRMVFEDLGERALRISLVRCRSFGSVMDSALKTAKFTTSGRLWRSPGGCRSAV